MSLDFLLETSNISRILFGELHDKPISPRGIRILEKTNLLQKDVELMISHFGSLEKVFNVDKENFEEIFKNENLIESAFEEIKKLKEKILVGKSIG